MQFPKSHHADGWYAHIPHLPLFGATDEDAGSTAGRWRVHAAAGTLIFAALASSFGFAAAHDPRPLDMQLRAAMQHAGETLKEWQALLSNGLQVSLRAVADGRDALPPELPADAVSLAATTALPTGTAPAAAVDAQLQPVRNGAPPAPSASH